MLIFLCVMLLASPIAGWGGDGHKIVAQIAANLIRPGTDRFIRTALSQMSARDALVGFSGWADDHEDPKVVHFMHIPERMCDEGCVLHQKIQAGKETIISAITRFIEIASDHAKSDLERAEAIKYLIHLLADIHQPLHVGFAEDDGGCGIAITTPDGKTMSLHQLWDYGLIALYLGGSSSWESVAEQITLEISHGEGKKPFQGDLDSCTNTEYVANIAEETATRTTCAFAYTHENGEYIESGQTLSLEYIQSRTAVVLNQLKLAGIRLAYALDKISSRYYAQEREEIGSPVARASSALGPSVNRFECLSEEFEPEDFLYEIDEQEAIVDEEAFAAKAAIVTEAIEPRKQKHVKTKIVCGVDMRTLVLIKRGIRLYVTSQQRVVHRAFVPVRFIPVIVQFSRKSKPVKYLFDGEVFDRHELPSLELVTAVFAQLGRRSEGVPLTVVPAASNGLRQAPFSSAAFPKVERHRTDEQAQIALFESVADDVIMFGVGNIAFASTYALVKSPAAVGDYLRVTKMTTSDSNDPSSQVRPLFIDVRFIGGELSEHVYRRLNQLKKVHKNVVKTKLVLATNPILLQQLQFLSILSRPDDPLLEVPIDPMIAAFPTTDTNKRHMTLMMRLGFNLIQLPGMPLGVMEIPMTEDGRGQSIKTSLRIETTST